MWRKKWGTTLDFQGTGERNGSVGLVLQPMPGKWIVVGVGLHGLVMAAVGVTRLSIHEKNHP